MRKIKLFSNNNDKSKSIENLLESKLKGKFIISNDNYDLAIAIGGDGAFLRMLKNTNFDKNIYYIGINTGTLGFLQEIKPKQIDEFVERLENQDYKVEEISIQKTIIYMQNEKYEFYSLNEIVIREKELNTLITDIKVDNVELEKFVGDGILISTSVGSTAYNLSFGGSIVYNTLHTLQITPIAPLNNRAYRNLLNSIVVPEDKLITIILNEEKQNVIVTIDGENKTFENVIKIETSVSEDKIKCIRMNDYDFISVVNEKFLKD